MGWTDGDYDIVMLYNGQPLRTHGARSCKGQVCCIHNPSDHHMKTWEHMWVATRHMMSRVCPCGFMHPDPDDVRVKFHGWEVVGHECCGLKCCVPPADMALA